MGWIRYSLAWHSNNALTLAHKNTNWLIWMWSMNKKKSNWIYKNIGRDLVIPASPVTSASIIAVAVGGVLLLLLIIDFICCLTLNIGMIATMCRRNKSPPSEIDEETKIGRWVMEIFFFLYAYVIEIGKVGLHPLWNYIFIWNSPQSVSRFWNFIHFNSPIISFSVWILFFRVKILTLYCSLVL